MGLKLLWKVFIWVDKLDNHCPIHLLIHMFDLSFHRNQLEDPDSRVCALLWGRRPGRVRQGRNGPMRMCCPVWQLPCDPAVEVFQLTGEEAGFLTLEHSIPHWLWAASRKTNSYSGLYAPTERKTNQAVLQVFAVCSLLYTKRWMPGVCR